MDTTQGIRPDFLIVDRDTGVGEVLVEARSHYSEAALRQFMDYMRLVAAIYGLFVSCDRSVILRRSPIPEREWEIHRVPTAELLGPVDACASEADLHRRVEASLEDWIRHAERGTLEGIPAAVPTGLMWPLSRGLLLIDKDVEI